MSKTKTRPAVRSKKRKCMQCRSRPERTRGLCMACYMAVRRSIASGEITDSEAVEIGLMLEPGQKARAGAIRRKIASYKRQGRLKK
jgi:hypothetical protein